MTKEELDRFLASKEAQLGLRTGELRSIWQQESSGSIDPTLKGPSLSKGRGNAVGPMQVVPYYHPDFPANGTVMDQGEYAAKFYAGLGNTPEERAAGYYGRGNAPAGHPTTSQYVQKVTSRLPQYQSQPQESNMENFSILDAAAPMDDEERKRREMMDYVNREAAARQASMQQRQYDPNEGQMPQRELSTFDRMMSNPLTQMGAAMMAASGTDWGRAGGMGLMAANNAIYNRQQAENELWELQEKRKESIAKRRREERKDQREDMSYEDTQRLADMYQAQGDPVTAARIRAGLTSGMGPEKFHATKTFVDPATGKPVTVMTGDQGTVKKMDGMGIPIAYDPETARNISHNKGEGTEAGQQGIKTLTGLYENASGAVTGLRAVEDMKTLLDQGMFTGRGDELTRELAGWYSWATGKELPKLAATEQYRLAVQDIVMPALSAMKGASSDRDVQMLQQYAQGTNMTESALRGALDRVQQKYGSEIDRFNRTYSQFSEGGKKSIVGFEPLEKPKGYIPRTDQKDSAQNAPAQGTLTATGRPRRWNVQKGAWE